MSQSLKAKQYIPVTEDESAFLKKEAAARGIGAGLLARVLFNYGVEHLDDQQLDRLVAEEKKASKERVSAGARVAVQARWGINNEEEK
ncbi:hypothetical protein ABZ700_11615 [Streptomyces diastaticus]|uniref:hypothetical protein n=1 Tax=Streptomyces diastaticus TaxID=1956 RepID=UPI0033E958A2